MQPVTFTIIGAGDRGLMQYGGFIEKNPQLAKVVGVAEPREWFRQEAVKRHSIPAAQVFTDWRQLAELPRISDAIIISTQDQQHVEPVLALVKKGYHVLLEKPMAPNEADCRRIIAAVKEAGVTLAVCHVLRYSPYFRKLRELTQSGRLGQLITVRHFEQVGFWHQAHSYVRGNWRNSETSSPMILAKSCHDMDLMLFLLGKRCLRLSSFGRLSHFTSAHKPKEATERCLDCPLSASICPYSAERFYLGRLQQGRTGWPLSVITSDFTESGVRKALATGPYGKCVYSLDNNVVDHQVLALEFEQGLTATFTMTAFTADERRRTEIFGSHGELRGDSKSIEITEFASGKTETFDLTDGKMSGSGHLGGDAGLMTDFILAIQEGNPARLTSDPSTSLESHLMAFAAERARLSGKVEEINL